MSNGKMTPKEFRALRLEFEKRIKAGDEMVMASPEVFQQLVNYTLRLERALRAMEDVFDINIGV